MLRLVATLSLALLAGCTLVGGPKIETTSPVEHLAATCSRLAQASDAATAGDGSALQAKIDDAVSEAQEYVDDYSGNEDAAVLLEYSKALRDVPPGGYEGQELAQVQAQTSEVGDICGSK